MPDVSDLTSLLVHRSGTSSPVKVNHLQTSSLGRPTQQSRLLSSSLLGAEGEDSEMSCSGVPSVFSPVAFVWEAAGLLFAQLWYRVADARG